MEKTKDDSGSSTKSESSSPEVWEPPSSIQNTQDETIKSQETKDNVVTSTQTLNEKDSIQNPQGPDQSSLQNSKPQEAEDNSRTPSSQKVKDGNGMVTSQGSDGSASTQQVNETDRVVTSQCSEGPPSSHLPSSQLVDTEVSQETQGTEESSGDGVHVSDASMTSTVVVSDTSVVAVSDDTAGEEHDSSMDQTLTVPGNWNVQ